MEGLEGGTELAVKQRSELILVSHPGQAFKNTSVLENCYLVTKQLFWQRC